MIKYGFQSSKFNNYTLEQELQISESSNIDFFDIYFDDYNPRDIEKIALPKNFSVSLPGNFELLNDSEKNDYIEFINKNRPKTVTIKFANLSIETLEKLVSSTPGIKICVENSVTNLNVQTNKNYLDFMDDAVAALSEKGLTLYSTFDTGHAKIAGYNPVDFLKKLIEKDFKIYTIHLHDNDGESDSHWPAGSVFNGIDFAEILRLVNNFNYDVFAVIEHWNNNYNALEYLKSL